MTARGEVAADVGTRAVRGSLVGLVNVAVGIGTAILTVPLLLGAWTEHEYAVWVAVFAVYTLLQTVDTGHTGYLGNEFLRLAHEDRAAYERTYASGMRMALVLGAAQLLVGLGIVAGGLVPRVLGLSLTDDQAWTAGLALLALSLGWWASGSFGGMIAGLYLPAGEFVRAHTWATANKLLLFGCLVVPALLGGGILASAVATGVGNVLFTAAFFLDARRRIPIARRWYQAAAWGEAVRNARRSVVVAANNASQQLSTSGLTLVVSALLGAVVLLAFTTLRTLANAATAITTVLVSPIVPDMVRYRARGEWTKLQVCFEACWFGAGAVVHLGTLLCFPLASVVYAAWTRGRIPFDAGAFALFVWAIGVGAVGAPGIRYLQAMNRLREQSACNVAYFVSLAAALPLAATGLRLSGVGVALVVAEAARSGRALHHSLADVPAEAREPLRAMATQAVVPLAVSGIALGASVAWPAHRPAICLAGALLLVLVYVAQWRTLDPELRLRVRRALPVRPLLGPTS